jgi:hypothetical protein
MRLLGKWGAVQRVSEGKRRHDALGAGYTKALLYLGCSASSTRESFPRSVWSFLRRHKAPKGNAYGIVMNAARQLTKFFQTESSTGPAEE